MLLYLLLYVRFFLYFFACKFYVIRDIAQISGVPKGIRTPVAAVKGQCPRPLDDGDIQKA